MLNRDSKVALLKLVGLFSTCSKRELGQIARMTTQADVAAGATIIKEDEETREFYVIVSGSVEAFRRGELLRSMGQGDFFGEVATLLGCPRTASVVATSSTQLLVLSGPDFFQLLHETGGLHRKVIKALGERLAPMAL